MSNTMKWLFVGDLQIPYHDKRAVALFMKVAKSWKPDAIDVVGDVDDQLEYSTFADGTTDEFFNQIAKEHKTNTKMREEAARYENVIIPVPASPDPLPFVKANADGARIFYNDLRAQHGNADIHNSLGNHDIRVFKYINKNAPECVKEVTPEFLWGLDNLGITWRHYDEKPFERFAGVYVHHGKTVSTTGLGVKGDIENYGISLVRGHDHRGGVVYKTYPISGRALVGMGTGHLCDPAAYGLKYAINPSWELGFGIAHVCDGLALMQFIRITPEYTCVVDGKRFEG